MPSPSAQDPAADWDGAGYEQVSDLQRSVAGRTLDRLSLGGDERCLDVGCGDGYLTKRIAARLPRGSVLGVDASPRMIEVAEQRPSPPGARLSFRVGSATDLGPPVLDLATFDLVVSFNVLHWVLDEGAALRSIAGATRPGGRVVLQLVCAGPRTSLESVAMRVSADDGWRSWFEGFAAPFVHPDPAAYGALAEQSGLRLTNRTVTDESWTFPTAVAFRAWCTVGFADWTARLPPDRVAGWVADVADRYGQITGDPRLFRYYQLVVELSRPD